MQLGLLTVFPLAVKRVLEKYFSGVERKIDQK